MITLGLNINRICQ